MAKVTGALISRLAWAVVLSLLLGTTAWAQSGAVQKGKSGKNEVRQPTQEEMQVLLEGVKPLVNQSDKGLTVNELSDGSKAVYLEGRFQNVALAKKNADGSVATGCVSTQKGAEKFLKNESGKPATKKEAVKKNSGDKDAGQKERTAKAEPVLEVK
jgi:hypothetical protein